MQKGRSEEFHVASGPSWPRELRKEGLPSSDFTGCLVLSLLTAAENRHPHAPEQSKW